MHALFVEAQPPAVGTDIAVRLTRHLCVRQLALAGPLQQTGAKPDHQLQGWRGPVAVVAQDPQTLLQQTQVQWTRLIRRAQTARRDTYDARYMVAFTDLIATMQSVHFTTNIQPDDEQQCTVQTSPKGQEYIERKGLSGLTLDWVKNGTKVRINFNGATSKEMDSKDTKDFVDSFQAVEAPKSSVKYLDRSSI